MSKYTVYYHTSCKGFYGRALAAALMLAEAGAAYDCKEGRDFTGKGFAVPMIETPSGAKCSQTVAIALVLGKKLGFSPSGPVEFAKACQICEDASDLMTEAFGGKPDERIQKWLLHFEDNLDGTTYFTGNSLSFADFHAFMTFTHVSQAKAALMSGYPKLQAWIEAMKKLKSSENLRKTGVPFLPADKGNMALL